MAQPTLQVKIMTPGQMLYQGPALAVSSKNSQGNFDLLAHHANFIALIENTPITLLKIDKQKEDFHFKEAIIYLTKDVVTILGDPESLAPRS